jgi:serine/threonine-protein kinase RsbW
LQTSFVFALRVFPAFYVLSRETCPPPANLGELGAGGTHAMFSPDQIPPRCKFDPDNLLIKLDAIIPSDVKVIEHTVARIVRLIETLHCWNDTDGIDLALQEALANAIIHGNRSDPNKAVRICVGFQPDWGLLIVVKDAGSGFDPSQLPNPVIGQNLLNTHGRGIFLINQLMQDVRFTFDHGTAIHMRRDPSPKL